MMDQRIGRARFGTAAGFRTRITSAAGLTLAETLTGIAIFLIIGAIAVPHTASLVQAHRLRSSANRLGLDLVRARTTAIARSSAVRVVISPQTYFMQLEDITTGAWRNLGGTVALPAQVSLEATRTEVQFSSTGIATPIRIMLSNGQSSMVIDISRLGRVQVS